jgi:acyl-CoA synthetase (AMP-forming)/AMP-acid ligase II
MRVIVVPSGVLMQRTVESFLSTFVVGISTAYFHTEAGGVVAVGHSTPGEELEVKRPAHLELYGTAGAPLPGVTVSVVDPAGQPVPAGVAGEIVVKSGSQMLGYQGTIKGDTYLSHGAMLHTGDEGVILDSSVGPQLVVLGRASDKVVRGGEVVNLALIESAVYEIRGVQFARAVPFSHSVLGTEVGVFVVVNKASNLSEAEIISQLSKRLPFGQMPRIVKFGNPQPGGGYETSREVLSLQFRGL